MSGNNWTFWLNMANFALGVFTLLALLVVLVAVGQALLARKGTDRAQGGQHPLRQGVRVNAQHDQ
jgi:UPF0716 family protein affecting phage T7 exclusion